MPWCARDGGRAADVGGGVRNECYARGHASGGKSAAMSAALRPAVQWGWLVAFVAGALVAAFALPKAQPKAQPIAVDDAPVLAADTALGDAMRAGDKAAARRLLALQFTFVDADGKIHTRKDFLADLKERRRRAGKRRAMCASMALSPWSPGSAIGARRRRVLSRRLGQAEGRVARAADPGRRDRRRDAAAGRSGRAPRTAYRRKTINCKNPCQTIPYRVRSPAEQDVVNAFQAIDEGRRRRTMPASGENMSPTSSWSTDRPDAGSQIRTDRDDRAPEGEQRRRHRRRGADDAAFSLWRRRGDDREPKLVPDNSRHAVPRRARVGKAQRPMADGDQRCRPI